jgi:hypothetical protein
MTIALERRGNCVAEDEPSVRLRHEGPECGDPPYFRDSPAQPLPFCIDQVPRGDAREKPRARADAARSFPGEAPGTVEAIVQPG